MTQLPYASRSAVGGHWGTPSTKKVCGHIRHFGPCPWCQREQLARWELQLAQVSPHWSHR